jgi:hypothetical protein
MLPLGKNTPLLFAMGALAGPAAAYACVAAVEYSTWKLLQ